MADFLSAYLMNGADELKRKFVCDRLVSRIAAMGDLDFNRDDFSGPSTNADEVIASCNMLPFMSEYRLVMIKDVDKAPKAVQEALVSYLDNPCESTILAMTASKLAKNTRLYKAVAKIDKKAVVNCEPKSKRDLPAQVRDFALSHGVTITQQAAVELIDMVGESTVHLDTEIVKLAATLGKGSEIGIAHVQKLVARTNEVKPWDFTDAVSDRDAKRAAMLLSRMPSQSPLGLLAQTTARIRELLIAKDFEASRSQTMLAQELGLPDWRVKNHFRWSSKFTQAELEKALVSAADLEHAMKSGADQWGVFTVWALELCTRG